MHTEGQTHSRGNRSGWWVYPAVGILMGLLGCVAPATMRRATAPRRPAPAVTAAPAPYALEDIRLSSTRETTHVVMTVSGPVQPLVQRVSQPDRLEITLPATQLSQRWSQQDVP